MLKVRNTSRLVFKKGKLCDKNTNLEKKAKLSESLIDKDTHCYFETTY